MSKSSFLPHLLFFSFSVFSLSLSDFCLFLVFYIRDGEEELTFSEGHVPHVHFPLSLLVLLTDRFLLFSLILSFSCTSVLETFHPGL